MKKALGMPFDLVLRLLKMLVRVKLGFCAVIFLAGSAFGTTLAISFQARSFTPLALIGLFAISVTVLVSTHFKQKKWRNLREEYRKQ